MGADGVLLNDLWVYDQDSLTWTNVTICGGKPPSARRGVCVCVVLVLIFCRDFCVLNFWLAKTGLTTTSRLTTARMKCTAKKNGHGKRNQY
jgi:hypothetical protein